MSKKKELLKNTVIIFLGKLCTQLISFLMLPLYTYVLSTEEYGTVDIITTYTALALPILGLQLEMGAFRYLVDSRKNSKNIQSIVSNTLSVILLSILFFAGVFLIISLIINIPYSILILISTIATLLSHYLLQVARGLGDNIGYSIGSVITGIVTVLSNLILLLVFHCGVTGVLISITIANIINVIYLSIREKLYKYYSKKALNKKEIQKLLKYSLPLIPNSLIWWIINVSDRTIIAIIIGASANGIYAVAGKFSAIINQIFNIFNLSWTESASIHINDKDKDKFFSDVFNSTLKIIISISILMLAYMPILFKIMVNDKYDEAYRYIPILSLGMIFNVIVTFLGAIYVAKKRTKEVATTSIWSGIINIVINIIFIKTIGLWAAALSTLVAFLIMSIYRLIDIQKYVKLSLDKKNILSITAIYILCNCLYYSQNTLMQTINIVISTLCVAITNKMELKQIVKTTSNKILDITIKGSKNAKD